MDHLLAWAMAALAASLYLLLYISYRRAVEFKRQEVVELITKATRGTNASRTSKEQDNNYELYEQRASALFDLKYALRAYALPLFLASTVTFFGALAGFVKAGDSPLPSELTLLFNKLPPTFLAGIAGAFLSGLWELIRRHRQFDYSPDALHRMWQSLLAAPLIATLLSAALKDEVALIVAFGVGATPWRDLIDLVSEQARSTLKLQGSGAQGEPPTLHHLQGMTRELIDSFREEQITSTEHLAYADPINLLLASNVNWVRILDLIDQALLHGYLGEKCERLRPFGIRGAIEATELWTHATQGAQAEQTKAQETLSELAKTLEIPAAAVNNLMLVLSGDPQLTFLRSLWVDSFENDESTASAGEPARLPSTMAEA